MIEPEPDDIADTYLSLARSFVDDDRYRDAIAAYRRSIAMLEELDEPRALVTAKVECFLALLEADELDEAGRMYHDVYQDLDRFGLELSEFEEFMFPLCLRVAHGDTEGVLAELQSYVDDGREMVPLDDMISLMQFAASVHEREASPVQAAHMLMAVAEMYESVAEEYGKDQFRRTIARAYWDHARFLARTREQCVFEAEAGFDVAPEGLEPEQWEVFLTTVFDEYEPGCDMRVALRARVLTSLDAADRWLPIVEPSDELRSADASLRALVGSCRVFTLIQAEDHPRAMVEAKRVIPIAEQAGDYVSAGALRSIVDLLSRDFDGPDFDSGPDFGR